MSKTYLFAFINVIKSNISAEEKIEILDDCLKNDVDINYDNSKALTLAVQFYDYKICKYLIDNGINYRANNDEALVQACRCGKSEICDLLLELGADPDAQDGLPMKFCAANYMCNTIKLLVGYGADLFKNLDYVLARLCYKPNSGSMGMIMYLIDMNITFKRECNLFMFVLFYYDYTINNKIKKLLFDNGADPNIIFCCGNLTEMDIVDMFALDTNVRFDRLYKDRCLLEVAIANPTIRDCEMLINYGANVNLYKEKIVEALRSKTKGATRNKFIELFLNNGLDISDSVKDELIYVEKLLQH